jgi:hypothetical protein
MGMLERREVLTHSLGLEGRLSVKTVTGKLRVRGTEGEEARVIIDYRIRASDQPSAERALDTGRVLVNRGPGTLEVETPERRLSTGLAWLFGGARVSADITVEVPWGASVRMETMSGSIEADALVGEQRYRTISGDIRLWRLAGSVDASSISGGIFLDTDASLRLRANSISGGIKTRVASYYDLMLSTTSGGMSVAGAFDPGGDHRAETIAGSLDLAPLSGVTVELKTVSGSIHGSMAHQLEGTRGNWRAIVGDGRASLRVNSTSGSIRLMGPSPAAEAPAAPAAPRAPEPPTAPRGPDAPAAGESWSEETAEEAAAHDAEDRAEDEELVVLRALERGEIGVDEATARLDEARR